MARRAALLLAALGLCPRTAGQTPLEAPPAPGQPPQATAFAQQQPAAPPAFGAAAAAPPAFGAAAAAGAAPAQPAFGAAEPAAPAAQAAPGAGGFGVAGGGQAGGVPPAAGGFHPAAVGPPPAAAGVPPAAAGVPPAAAGFHPPQTGGATSGAAGIAGAAAGAAGATGGRDAFGGVDPAAFATSTTTHTPSPAPPLAVLPGTPDNSAAKHAEQKLPTAPWKANQAACAPSFSIPEPAPLHATHFNGVQLPDACFLGPSTNPDGYHHVLVVGDWGGLTHHPWNTSVKGPLAADHRDAKHFKNHHRPYVYDVDDFAQEKVAKAMQKRAETYDPDYIINVGDSFYWGGINVKCGAPAYRCADITGQWKTAFEEVYTGYGIDNKPWLGVLGNHDYGGFMFTAGWDQLIGYSWLRTPPSKNRWIIPAQYWMVKTQYDSFTIDWLFVDTNVFDTWLPEADQHHNICSRDHNQIGATCGVQGPVSAAECPHWFKNLWHAQVPWMETALSSSTAQWQIIVVHHPPEGMWGGKEWQRLSQQYGIDLILSGHRHRQEVHRPDSQTNQLRPTAYVVSGGGGGITSENKPDYFGADDEYGFVDLTLTANEIMIEALSHGGEVRSTTCITQRQQGGGATPLMGVSLCANRPSGPRPETLVTPAPTPEPQPETVITDAQGMGMGQDTWTPTTGDQWPSYVPAPAPLPPPPPSGGLHFHFYNPFTSLLKRLRR